jgi:hypothetical protein
VHDVRYLLGYGDPGRALAQQGHEYLGSVYLFAGAALALAAAELLGRFARARRGAGAGGAPPGFRVLWAAASVALMAVYSLQESIEGAVSTHHPAGVAGVLGHGGWTALLLAIAVGALVALLLRGAHAALVRVAGRDGAPRRAERRPLPARPRDLRLPRAGGLARNLAGRGPPLTV